MATVELLFGPNGWAGLLLQGTAVTVLLALAAAPVGFGAGLLLAVMKASPRRLARAVAEAYGTFFRGIPDLLALFIVYFGLQLLLDRAGALVGVKVELNAFLAGVLALGTVTAAYSAEVWVAARAGVPPGQAEAALSLGLSRNRMFRLVLLPQIVRVALPGLGNVWTILLKDTSLISTLAVMDLLRAASEASRSTRSPLLFFAVACAIYLVLGILSAVAQTQLERRANRGWA